MATRIKATKAIAILWGKQKDILEPSIYVLLVVDGVAFVSEVPAGTISVASESVAVDNTMFLSMHAQRIPAITVDVAVENYGKVDQ